MEFWNSELTEQSWLKLIELKGQMDFMLIGGWAIYVYTKLYKSKDIDIVVSYDALNRLKSEYALSKNERLKKYEIKLDRFDIDIYLPNYSRLALPLEDVLAHYAENHGGFTLPTPEALLALKFGALLNRKRSIKGEKDMIDVVGMLLYSGLDAKKLYGLLHSYNLTHYIDELLGVLKTFDKRLLQYLNLNEKSFSKQKKKKIDELRNAHMV